MPFGRSRARRRVAAGVLVVVGVVLAVSARLFIWAPTDAPARADAIVALGGDPGQHRAAQAVALARAGYASTVVVSLGGIPPAPCPRPERGITIECFRADPLDTRGEAEHVAAMIGERHWQSIILVPSRSQATRARLLFERCTSARLIVVPVADPTDQLPYDVAYEWGALAKALVLQRSC